MVFRRLSNPLGVGFNEVMAEMTEYEERLGPYSPKEAPNIQVANLQPHQWWSRVGGEALPKIAKSVLALMCSASLCERNWSMYLFFCAQQKPKSSWYKEGRGPHVYLHEYEVAPR